jgi:hypothetical protein
MENAWANWVFSLTEKLKSPLELLDFTQ